MFNAIAAASGGIRKQYKNSAGINAGNRLTPKVLDLYANLKGTGKNSA
jgi:hypothetical protein